MPPKKDSTVEFLKGLKVLYTESKDAEKRGEVIKTIPKVYIVYGGNQFIRDRSLQRLKQIAENIGFSVERTIFERINVPDWIESLQDVPMFSKGRLVIASELSELKDEQLETIANYIKKPSPDVILLLLSSKLDKRKKTTTALLKNATACEAEEPKLETYHMWIKGFAAERGKVIEDKAIEYLKVRYEGDLARIEKEVEKAAVYVGARGGIRGEDIEFLATGSSGSNVFELSNHIAFKNKKRLLETLHKLLEAGEHPVLICSIITTRIRKLLLAQSVIDKVPRAADVDLTAATGIPPYFIRDLREELLHYKRNELAIAYKRCMDMDAKLKSSKVDGSNVILSGVLDLLERR